MHRLYLPRLGQTMEKGTVQAWMKEEGDSFEVGDVLYEVETEKVVTEVEAKQPGTLVRIVVREGEERPAGTVLAIAADPGEEISEEEIEKAVAEANAATGEEAADAPAEEPALGGEEEALDRTGGKVRAMPKARALARELGVDLAAVEGSGKNGSITVGDVRAAADGARDGDETGDAEGPRVAERRSLSGLGKTMAEVVSRSWREVPQFVQMVELDASALVERRRAERVEGASPSYTDLLIEAMVGAVEEVPLANASFVEGEEIVVYRDVNVSMAVATEAGLVVPVVRRAQELSLGELAAATREVAEKAREGRLTAEDVEGGTITLSNLGMLGVEAGTPLVTAPQATVVFAGAIVEKPLAVDGKVDLRPALTLSIGYDHRVLDGATASRFTTALKRRLEGAPAGEGTD